MRPSLPDVLAKLRQEEGPLADAMALLKKMIAIAAISGDDPPAHVEATKVLILFVTEFEAALMKERRLSKKLLRAAKLVLAGLFARIDAAPSTAKPVFSGIAELHAAINKIEAKL